MADDCIFCKIAGGEIPAKVLYRDDEVVAFEDIAPQAPFHVLVVPCRHISTLNDAEAGDDALLGRLVLRAARLAAEHDHARDGYRTVFNCNRGAGQTVFHIHLHLLAGRSMNWPPG